MFPVLKGVWNIFRMYIPTMVVAWLKFWMCSLKNHCDIRSRKGGNPSHPLAQKGLQKKHSKIQPGDKKLHGLRLNLRWKHVKRPCFCVVMVNLRFCLVNLHVQVEKKSRFTCPYTAPSGSTFGFDKNGKPFGNLAFDMLSSKKLFMMLYVFLLNRFCVQPWTRMPANLLWAQVGEWAGLRCTNRENQVPARPPLIIPWKNRERMGRFFGGAFTNKGAPTKSWCYFLQENGMLDMHAWLKAAAWWHSGSHCNGNLNATNWNQSSTNLASRWGKPWSAEGMVYACIC